MMHIEHYLVARLLPQKLVVLWVLDQILFCCRHPHTARSVPLSTRLAQYSTSAVHNTEGAPDNSTYNVSFLVGHTRRVRRHGACDGLALDACDRASDGASSLVDWGLDALCAVCNMTVFVKHGNLSA